MFNFQAGNTIRMDTASAVIIIRILFRKGWPVGMSCNEDMLLPFCPLLQPFFRFMLSRIIFCRTGRVEDTEMLQRLPQVTDKEAG